MVELTAARDGDAWACVVDVRNWAVPEGRRAFIHVTAGSNVVKSGFGARSLDAETIAIPIRAPFDATFVEVAFDDGSATTPRRMTLP